MNLKRLAFAFVFASVLAVGLAAGAETLERREGLKIGERLTLRPYVTMSATYDSNVGASGSHPDMHKRRDFFWSISPSLWLHYNAETWSIILSGFYTYHQYFKNENRGYDSHNYGEDFRWNWANSTGREKGWSLVLGQSFQQRSRSSSDITTDSGARYGYDSRQFQLAASAQRRLNQYLHGDVNASYYWLDYDNSSSSGKKQPFYGWDRWLAGAEIGFAPSPWTDIIVSGSYQGYSQKNTSGTGLSQDSSGYSFQAGLGSYMTERISYRVLAGWSHFEYAGTGSSGASDGFVYTVSGNWKIGDTWNTMLLATSYFQPSERQQASKSRVDAVSWGLAKTMIRGKLRATADLRYRRETNEYQLSGGNDYVLNIWTGRIGLSYSLIRYLSVHAYGEYQKSMNDDSSSRHGAYDYDRLRLTVGLKLSY